MSFFKKLFAPKEVRAAIGVLDELKCTFDCAAFSIIHKQVERMILANSHDIVAAVRKGRLSRQLILGLVSSLAGDHVESGDYHVYRGVLNPLGPGEDFIKIYDTTVDELVRMGVVEAEYAEKQKAALRENIETIG